MHPSDAILLQMVNIPGLDPAALEAAVEASVQSIIRSRCAIVAAYSLQVYEWLLQLENERRLVHKSRWTTVKTLYLFCRYYPLFVFPYHMWAWLGSHSAQTCDRIIHPTYALVVPYQISAQAVICLRTYAFTGRNKIVAAILCSFFLTVLSAQIWEFAYRFHSVTVLHVLIPTTGCFGNDEDAVAPSYYSPHKSPNTGRVIMASFVLDCLSLSLVILHCIRTRSVHGALGKSFLRQGVIVFVILSSLNLTTATLYLIPNPEYDGIVLPFTLIISDVLACRLILLLRERVSPTESFQLQEQSRIVNRALLGINYAPNLDADECSMEATDECPLPPLESDVHHSKDDWTCPS